MDDYNKLTCVIKNLRRTIELPLILEGNDANVMKWWIDVSYAVHPDMKSHTGGIFSFGRGAACMQHPLDKR